MHAHLPRRVVAFFALLVIVMAGFGLQWLLAEAPIRFLRMPPDAVTHLPTLFPTPNYQTASATPFDPLNEYYFHRQRDELMVALYHVEAQSAAQGWTAQAHIRAGNLWRDMGDFSRALFHWEAANRQEANPNLLRQIAHIYLARGEWSLAWERIQALLALAPNDSWGLYHGGLILAPSDPMTAFRYLGQVVATDNPYTETAQAINQVIVHQEQADSEVILRVAAILVSAQEWSLAENAYQYAADVYYPFPEATAYIGLMRILQGKNGERQIDQALHMADDNATVYYLAGVYWRAAGDYVQSEEALLVAILLQPNTANFYAELGNTYSAMGNRYEAELWLQTAVQISDHDPVLVHALQQFYEADSDFVNQPLLAFTTGINRSDDPSILAASGWAMHLTGDTAGGLYLIDQALAIDPDNSRALFDRARILLDTDRSEQALPLLTTLAEGESAFAESAQRLLETQAPAAP